MVDGSLIFDTGIDKTGFDKGINTLQIAAGSAIGNIAADMVSKLSSALSQVPAQMISIGSGFEASMSQVAATMGITSAAAEFEILSDAAKEMGETTKYSASQAGEALNYLALAGYDAEKAVSALPTVLNVAAAGGMELAEASDMITDAMSALGLETSQMADFADKLAVTSQKSNTSVAQLGSAILTVGGTAKQLAGGVVEMNTALGLLADNGIKGAEGGTALRNIILSLTAPTNTAAEAIDALGLQVYDAEGKMRSLQDIMFDLNDILNSMSTDAERNQALNDVFNKVDLKSVNALLGTSAERWNELTGYISDCSGAAAEMAATMDDNLKGDITILQSAIEGLGIAAYEKFQIPFRDAAQNITDVVSGLTANLKSGELSDSFDKISKSISDFTESAIQIAADDIIPLIINATAKVIDFADRFSPALLAAAAAFGTYKLSVQVATVAQNLFNVTCSINPILALVSAIGLLTVAVAGYNKELAKYDEYYQEGYSSYTEQISRIDNLTSSYEKVTTSSKEMVAAQKEETNRLTSLKNALSEQVDAQGKVIGNEQLVRDIISEINEIYPVNIELINGQIQGYDRLSSSIDNYLDKKSQEVLLDSKKGKWKEAVVVYDETSKQHDELLNNALEADAVYKEALRKYERFHNGVNDYTSADKKAADAAGLSITEYFKKQLEVTQGSWEAAWESYNKNKLLMDEASADIADYENALNDYNKSTTSPWAAYFQKQSEWLVTARQDAIEEIELSNEEITKKLSDGWKAAEHNYAMGVIGSEEELYTRKQQLLNEYGNAELEEHWQYYEELIEYQKNYAKQSAEEYKQQLSNEWDTINHQNKMGLLSDEEAYEKKLAFIRKYCPEYSDEWYDYYKDIYDYQKSASDEQLEVFKDSMQEQVDVVSESLKDIVSEYKEAYKKIQDNIDSYKKKLLSVGDTLSVIENKDGSKTLKVNDLREQLAAMREYHKYMTELKNAGASAGLLSELNSMDFADSSAFAKNLAGLSSSDFAQINDYYKEKEQLAQELANELYQPDIDQLNTDLVANIKSTLGTELPEAMREAGMAALDEFIAGLTGNNLAEQVDEFGTKFTKDLSESIKNGITNDDFAIDFDNLFTQDPYTAGQNFGSDFADGFNAALEEMTAAVQAEQAQVSAEYTMKNTSAAAENADAAGTKSKTSSASERIVVENHIHAQLDVDGRKMAETTMQYEDIIRREKGK